MSKNEYTYSTYKQENNLFSTITKARKVKMAVKMKKKKQKAKN